MNAPLPSAASSAVPRRCHIQVLGSGTSTGVPIIGCTCPACTSADPHDNRMRCGLHLSYDGFHLQIDTSPDFRQQALRYRIPRVDAILISHCHADHVLGLDEVRRYNQMQKDVIPVYCRDFCEPDLRRIFGYIFSPPPLPPEVSVYRPHLTLHVLGDDAAEIGPFRVRSLTVPHGPALCAAFEIAVDGRRMVHCSDVSEVTPELLDMMRGADIVFLDGLRPEPHAAHITQPVCLEALRASGCRIGRMIHIGHQQTHAELLARYPEPFAPTYDGEEFFL